MNEALLIILAFLWALMLLPGAIRARRSSPRATVGGFHHAMEVLRQRPSSGRTLMVPDDSDRIVRASARGDSPTRVTPAGAGDAGGRAATEREVIARRRRLFGRLLMATAALLVVALVAGGLVWVLLGVSVAVLVGYTVLLRRWKVERDQAREVVRDITPARRRPSPEPEPADGRAVATGRRQPARVAGGGAVAEYATSPWPASGNVRLRPWRSGG